MGAFFTNCHVRTKDTAKCLKAVSAVIGKRALVTDCKNGWITIYDEESESQDINTLRQLAESLSSKLKTVAMGMLVHDSDIFQYVLYEKGKLIDQFDSKPDHFGAVPDAQKKEWRGNLAKLVPYSSKKARLADFERAASQELVVEEERAAQFAKLLGIDPDRARTGFKYVQQTEHAYHLLHAKGFSKNDALLVEAVSRGDAEKVGALLAKGASPDQKGKFDEPLLVIASRRKSLEIAQDLIAHGADLFAEVRGGGDALWMAASEGQEKIVALILERANGNPKLSASIHTAFSAAIERGHYSIVQLLIRAGADVNANTLWKQPPLTVACMRGLEFVYEAKVGKPLPQRPGEPKTDWKQVVMVLLDAGAQIPFPVKGGPIDAKALSAEQKSKLADALLEAGSRIKAPASLACERNTSGFS